MTGIDTANFAKQGNIVSFNIQGSLGTLNGWSSKSLSALPEGWRPLFAVGFKAITQGQPSGGCVGLYISGGSAYFCNWHSASVNVPYIFAAGSYIAAG